MTIASKRRLCTTFRTVSKTRPCGSRARVGPLTTTRTRMPRCQEPKTAITRSMVTISAGATARPARRVASRRTAARYIRLRAARGTRRRVALSTTKGKCSSKTHQLVGAQSFRSRFRVTYHRADSSNSEPRTFRTLLTQTSKRR